MKYFSILRSSFTWMKRFLPHFRIILVISMILVIISTLIDRESCDIKSKNPFLYLVRLFSLKRNVNLAINLDERKNNLSCLDGLRVIMAVRVMIFHAYSITQVTMRNPDENLYIHHFTSTVSMIFDVIPLMNIFIMITGLLIYKLRF